MESFRLLSLLLVLAQGSFLFAGETLKSVLKKGEIRCGVNNGIVGFSAPDSDGSWKGIDVDLCRAMASAIFGAKAKIKFVPLSAQQRFTALQSGEIDVLTRNTTRTLTRDAALGFNFGPVNFYDGQGLMVKKELGIKSAKELDGATICIQTGTTTELNISDYFRTEKMKFKPLVIESNEEVFKAFMAGRCDVLTTDASQLASMRLKAKKPEDLVILPEIISKEPLAPAVRHGDDQWLDLLMWSHFAMVEAEELGINQANVDSFLKSENPRVKRLLGKIPGNGKALGVKEDWAYQIIKAVGNYGESFYRNVGEGSRLKLSRGLNQLWTKQGLMYAPPLR